jgi:NAD(P)-dependent dehydrogenase (short-subunit alcohol dehydrogenase family)
MQALELDDLAVIDQKRWQGLSGASQLDPPGSDPDRYGRPVLCQPRAQPRTNDVDAAPQLALSGHPIGRLGAPDDIAKAIVFLASDDAGFMTGAGLVVDGGLTVNCVRAGGN